MKSTNWPSWIFSTTLAGTGGNDEDNSRGFLGLVGEGSASFGMSANLPAVTMGAGEHPELTPDAVVTVLLLLPAPDTENSGTDPAIAVAGGILTL